MSHAVDYADVQAKLTRFYEKNAPEKTSDVPKVLEMMKEADLSEHELFDMLCKKYRVLYDPLEWKAPIIGRGHIGGARVEMVGGSDEAGAVDAPRASAGMNGSTSTRSRPGGYASAPAAAKPVPASPPHREAASVAATENEERAAEDPAFAQRMAHRRQCLTDFYKKYNPAKLSDVDAIMQLSTESTNEEIFEKLCKKYNAPKKAVFKQVGIGAEGPAGGAVDADGKPYRDRLQALVQHDQSELILRQEFAEWLTIMLRKDPPYTAEDVFNRLKDGVDLCLLLEGLQPGIKIRYHAKPGNHFQKLANVEAFLQSCQRDFGLDNSELFDPVDLVEECGELERRRIMTLFLAVAKTCHKNFKTVVPQIVKIELEVDAEEENTAQEVTHDDVERMLAQKREEEEAARLAAEEERRAEEERKRLQRHEEKLEKERARKAAEAERLRHLKQYEEEERTRAEQRRLEAERLRAQQEQERLRVEQEKRRQAALRAKKEREERARIAEETRLRQTSAPAEDNPVFQYKGEKYVSNRRDQIDVRVGEVVNEMPSAAAIRLFRIKEGMYVIEYPKRIVFFVRLCRDRVMIRVGGGWATLTEFLSRRLRENPEKLPKFIPIQRSDGQEGITFLHRAANRYTSVV
eukprot:TRINITY_DN7965_c0_g1_i1.p2 TRINITY_DN7965_c0_g1~~TRINITY_DN7965_c0_g1_i1.p2  ORF type:complete len:633 (+),score=286.35 TRINITY_DN7965_c0_g1_i1:67-1965(+)